MEVEKFNFPKNSIIVGEETKIFVMIGKKKKRKISDIIGLLKDYRKKYSSVELQHKSKDWWSNVPS